MPESLEFSEYSFRYSTRVKQLRRSLPPSLRPVLDEIEDKLTEDPEQYLTRTIILSESENIYIYKHPNPFIEITYKIDREKKIIYFLHLVAPLLETAKPLFISYSHIDKKYLLELKKWLKPLEQSDLITIWDDSEIKAGDEWRDEIEKALNSAKAAILLISQDFLTSEFITEVELPSLLDSAKEKGVKILWIAVRTSTVSDSVIKKYQAVHIEPPLDELDDTRREKEYFKIYETIKKAIN
jgi:hypothetical protein